ncbi:MAG: hypothetical protein JNN05_00255, partial [Candidatus Omnitrophica bacterium]|nr:hypothetical protein [Candidatus Omnitrophota bacterium]
MVRNLIIVEFKEEVEFFLQNHPALFKENVKVVALLPESSVMLSSVNIPHENTIPYFPKESHQKCLGYIDAIITKINNSIKIEDRYGLRKTYVNALTFYLRWYLSYVLGIVEIIKNILDIYPATKLHVCGYLQSDSTGFSLTGKERFL